MGKRIYENHGDTGTRLHAIWKGIKCRCYSKNWVQYKNYGERGIEVCDEWKGSYLKFKEWSLNNGYEINLEIDRINVNGNYCPENCQWTTHYNQTVNRRDTLYVYYYDKEEHNEIKFIDFLNNNNINKSTANGWRYHNILEKKILEKTGLNIIIKGGKKNRKVE